MFPTYHLLRQQLALVIDNKGAQGHVIAGLQGELDALPDSYDALDCFSQRLAHLPLRSDWAYVEPNELERSGRSVTRSGQLASSAPSI